MHDHDLLVVHEINVVTIMVVDKVFMFVDSDVRAIVEQEVEKMVFNLLHKNTLAYKDAVTEVQEN